MFMYYCGLKGRKFGEWSQTAAKVLRSRENHVEYKIFLGGHAPKPPRNAQSRAGHVIDMCRATTFDVT